MDFQPVFVDTASGDARAWNDAAAPVAVLKGILETELPVRVAFATDYVPGELPEGTTGRLVVKAANDLDGAPLLLVETWTETGTGTGARYTFDLLVDSEDLREALLGKVSLDLLAQVEWTLPLEEEPRKSVPFLFHVYNSVAVEGDEAPDPRSDKSWAWLKSTLQVASGVTKTTDETAKTITLTVDPEGIAAANDGWSPVLAVETDGARRVQKIVSWTGGGGTAPASGKYLGATGLVDTAAEAVDVRGATGAQGPQGVQGVQGEQGPAGPEGGPAGAQGEKGWSPLLACVEDGLRRVLQVVDWTGGEGTKPATGVYLKIDGVTSDIAEATDIRGPEGAGALVPAVAYVTPTGDDGTGAVGNLAAPYATWQAAFDAVMGLGASQVVIQFGPGEYGDLTLSADMSDGVKVTLRGAGEFATTLGTVLAQGAAGADVEGATGTECDASDGWAVRFHGARDLTITGIVTTGGNGGTTSDPAELGNVVGGKGGRAGVIKLRDLRVGSVVANGGAGGVASGTGSTGGAGGALNDVILIGCEIAVLEQIKGAGGSGDTPGADGDTSGADYKAYHCAIDDAETEATGAVGIANELSYPPAI